MAYFSQLRKFEEHYRPKSMARLKLRLLYPIFKLHFWFYYGSALKRSVARSIFQILPKKYCVKIECFSPILQRYYEIPLWFIPDHLSSFQEIFWSPAYVLETNWRPKCLIDAGANVGYASLYFAVHHDIKTILAIEANPALYPKLELTAQILKTIGVDIRLANGALVGHSRSLEFQINENSRNSSIEPQGRAVKTTHIDGRRLEEWKSQLSFKNEDLKTNCLFKIDIEGAEYEVLKEDNQVFTDIQYLIAEIHGEQLKRDVFVRSLAENLLILSRTTTPACDTVEVLFGKSKSA